MIFTMTWDQNFPVHLFGSGNVLLNRDVVREHRSRIAQSRQIRTRIGLVLVTCSVCNMSDAACSESHGDVVFGLEIGNPGSNTIQPQSSLIGLGRVARTLVCREGEIGEAREFLGAWLRQRKCLKIDLAN